MTSAVLTEHRCQSEGILRPDSRTQEGTDGGFPEAEGTMLLDLQNGYRFPGN